jgi:MarR family transcriptional regulator, organic hydroperoxide resistance regulator
LTFVPYRTIFPLMKTDSIISLISRIRERANEFLVEQLEQRGVTGIVSSHGNILVQLYRHGPLPMNRLASLIGRKKNTLTVLVGKLKTAGYVKLSKSPTDSRVTLVELTETGSAFRQQFQDISRVLLERTWGDIPPSEREPLVETLEKLEKNLGGR